MMVPRVIRTYRQTGASQDDVKTVIDVPATDLTWDANLETLADEMRREGFALVDAATVADACRRLLVGSDGGSPPDVGSRSQRPGEGQ